MTQAPEPVTTHRPSISPALAVIVMRCLAKRPADRWQTADELLAQLEPLVMSSGGMTPAETRPFAAAKRRVPAWVVASFVAGVVATGIAVFLIAGRHSRELVLGRRSQLTRDPGLELDPAVSPDGKFVAYVAGPGDRLQHAGRGSDGRGAGRKSSAGCEEALWSPAAMLECHVRLVAGRPYCLHRGRDALDATGQWRRSIPHSRASQHLVAIMVPGRQPDCVRLQ